jgi:glucosamine-6-phosphate deaminase
MFSFRCDELEVVVYESNDALGAAAADDLAGILRERVAQQGEASVILATGNSQLSFAKALSSKDGIPWDRISVFHMDEYLGLSDQHPASFRRYIRRQLTDIVHPRAFYGMEGDAPDMEREMERYAALLQEKAPVACVLGIGENGHLAFNDPPANFADPQPLRIIELAPASRQQQVGEGHFPALDDVPQQAVTLTIPVLLGVPHVLCVVPERRKAEAVCKTLQGPVGPDCPASIMRTMAHVRVYLDQDSSSQLDLAQATMARAGPLSAPLRG